MAQVRMKNTQPQLSSAVDGTATTVHAAAEQLIAVSQAGADGQRCGCGIEGHNGRG